MWHIRAASYGVEFSRWDALLDLFHRPFWSRIWILQEVMMATDLLVLYGDDTVDWLGCESIIYDMEMQKIGGRTDNELGHRL